jgi:hypothetical protein
VKSKNTSALLSQLDLDLENPRLFEAEPSRSENEVLCQLACNFLRMFCGIKKRGRCAHVVRG